MTGATIDAEGVTLSGIAAINLGNGTIFRGVPFTVTVIGGGAGAGQLR